MLYFDDRRVAAALERGPLIEALQDAFRRGVVAPARASHALTQPEASLLLMPAWDSSASFGVKLVTVFPQNQAAGLPAVNACYVVFDSRTGAVRAIMDGHELTLRRTAAASALASRLLSRADSARLLMVGTGSLAPHLIESHCLVRPIESVLVWGRTPAHARRIAGDMSERLPQALRRAVRVETAVDLREAAAWADIISCATLAGEPLIHGVWLRPGQHLDLVGSYKPGMREADTNALLRADVFVDVRASATVEAGEIVAGLRGGHFGPEHILADLHDLTRHRHGGRSSDTAITLFKSVGHAIEDLAAAQLVLPPSPDADPPP
jgi:alanine dehydrogenase